MRYRLPEVLGGGEYDSVADIRSKDGKGTPFDLPGLGHIVWLPTWILTEVKPPLPEEPPIDDVVLVDGEALQRFDDESRYPHVWAAVGGTARYTWVQLCDLALPGAPVRLVPDPFAEPVKLPWRRPFDDSLTLLVDRSSASNRAVYVDGLYGHITADEARDMARALWAAANAAEKEQGHA